MSEGGAAHRVADRPQVRGARGRRRRPGRRRPCRATRSRRDAGDGALAVAPEVERPAVGDRRPARCAIGAHVIARNPVGWHNSSGGPSPPRSWRARVTPSVDGTERTGGEEAIGSCWQRMPPAAQPAATRGTTIGDGSGAGRVGGRCPRRWTSRRCRAGQPALLRRVRGPRPRRDVRHVAPRRRRRVHASGVEDAARVGRGGRVLVRPVRGPAAPAVHPHRRAGPACPARWPG